MSLFPLNKAILSNPQEYKSIDGALQYITVTWPVIAFCVNKVSQFMHWILI